MKSMIRLENVSFSYEKENILEDICLNVEKGDYFGIVGPNGSGKSTLIKLMLNNLKSTSGNVFLFDKHISQFKDWQKISYVNQKSNSFNSSFPATVEEIVSLNLFSKIGLFKKINKSHLNRVHEVLKIVGMYNHKNSLIGNLSGGQQQKVFIARALVNKPELIFLDEPTVGIDLASQEDFYTILEKLNKDMNITIVMISHDIGIISEKVNKIACLGKKQLILHDCSCDICIDKIIKDFYPSNLKKLKHYHPIQQSNLS